MYDLADWIEYGLKTRQARNKAMVRRWIREARGHKPIRDWRTFPINGTNR